jgi:hypothetical protein
MGDKGRQLDNYWEDPVYRYLSRQHRSALNAGDTSEEERLEKLMQQLVNKSMPDAEYQELDEEARADKKVRKQERKKQAKKYRPPAAKGDDTTSVNVGDLKKRIFNMQVSRENMIKALEALPAVERKATIAGLPPGLRQKLGNYLKND